MHSLDDVLFSTPAMADTMGDGAHLRQMCLFERALTQAGAQAGVIPAAAANIIVAVIDGAPDWGDAALFADAAKAGTLAIPLIKRLTMAVRAKNAEAAAFVHFGATSQDVIDTACALQLAEGGALLRHDLHRLAMACAQLAHAHRATLMLGRTLLQPATPVTFGLKAAQWLLAVRDCIQRLDGAQSRALVLQFGGAAGTLGGLGTAGPIVARYLAALLPSLSRAQTELPWHTRRGDWVALGSELGICVGICGKIARDIALMMQFEVGEAFEPAEAGRGGSSAMPHKRNPVRCMQTLAAATRAPHLVASLMAGMAQEHERALGGWQAEWAVFPQLMKIAAGALANMAATLEGLELDCTRMQSNFDRLNGLPMTESLSLALARKVGRDAAHACVEDLSRRVLASGQTLAVVASTAPGIVAHLDSGELQRALDPQQALGATQEFIDAALAMWKT